MKTSILKVAVCAIMTATSLLAQTENENFPSPGRIYNVTWTGSNNRGSGQIKVIRKGEGSWILVEYTHLFITSVPPPQPNLPPSDKPYPQPKMEKGYTKEMWINTQWLIDASEIETDKE